LLRQVASVNGLSRLLNNNFQDTNYRYDYICENWQRKCLTYRNFRYVTSFECFQREAGKLKLFC
jgi:hypothetical protein